jgi:hypothetical protein
MTVREYSERAQYSHGVHIPALGAGSPIRIADFLRITSVGMSCGEWGEVVPRSTVSIRQRCWRE